MKKLVVFDIDGVLADFEGRLHIELLKKFGTRAHTDRAIFSLEKRYEGEVLACAQKLVNDPNFYYGLRECLGGLDFLENILYLGHKVIYVSSRPKSAENFTKRWLIRKTSDDPIHLFCGISDKVDFLREMGESVDFIVEDNPTQIGKLKEAGFNVLCWDQMWNEGIFPRLYVRRDGELMLWEEESVEAQSFFSLDYSLQEN